MRRQRRDTTGMAIPGPSFRSPSRLNGLALVMAGLAGALLAQPNATSPPASADSGSALECAPQSARTANAGAAPTVTRAPRVVLISVDAGADWIVDRLMEQGKAPAFSAMARDGVSADGLISTMPSLTAAAHAALWTGAYGRSNGVNGNEVFATPKAEHTVLEETSAFLSTALTAEPIWVTAAQAGLAVLVPQATGVFPFPAQYANRLLMFDTFANRLAPDGFIEGRLKEGRFEFAVGDTPFGLVRSAGGGLELQSAGGSLALMPGLGHPFSRPVAVRAGGREGRARFRLIAWLPETGDFKIYRGSVTQIVSNRPAELVPFCADVGALIGGGAELHYRTGQFGPTLERGGNGDAERWFTEVVEADHEYADGMLAYAARQRWNLLVIYLSSFDMVGHALVGRLDPASTAYSPELAARIWPVVERLFKTTVDSHVAEIRRRFPAATVVVASDHGMEGVGRRVYPNVTLRNAGLLALDEKGQIDPARTKAVLVSSHTGQIFVNTAERKSGVVPESEKQAIKAQVTSLLLGIRDPETGRAAIRAVFDPDVDGAAMGIGGPAAGDLYLDPALGYSANVAARPGTPEVQVLDSPVGVHGPAPWRRNLLSIFYAVGPGVRPGYRLGFPKIVDVAPTIARLLGIAPPAQATGHALPLR